jgi:hypothetical protein
VINPTRSVARAGVAAALAGLLLSACANHGFPRETADLIFQGVSEEQRAACVEEGADWNALGAIAGTVVMRSEFKKCMAKAGGTFDADASEAAARAMFPNR